MKRASKSRLESTARNQPPTAGTDITVRPPRLAITGIEHTQAIQFFAFNGQGSGFAANNSVPLVADKATILRLYVNHSPAFIQEQFRRQITGTVSYTVNGNALTLAPINGPIPAPATSEIERGKANDTLNFRIPAHHCRDTLTLSVKIFTASTGGAGQAPTPAEETFDLTFQPVAKPRIHAVLIRVVRPNFTRPEPTCRELLDTLTLVVQMYPIAGFDITAIDIVEYNGNLAESGGGGCGNGLNPIRDLLLDMRAASGSDDIFLGLIPLDQPLNPVQGCAGGGFAIAKPGAFVVAHELGHSLGRSHAPCGNAGPPLDAAYPTFGSFPPGSIGEFGFDNASSAVFDPATSFDFMSAGGCSPHWISPHTFIALRNRLGVTRSRSAKQGKLRPYLHFNFRVHREGRVELLPSFCLDRSAPPAGDSGTRSAISCDLLDAGGKVIASHRCHADELCRLGDPRRDDDPFHDYREVIAWDDRIHSIAITRDQKAIGDIRVADAPPEVSIEPPKRDARRRDLVRLEWKGGHPSEPITYLLRYTHDGGKTWRVIATNPEESRRVVNLDLLAGGEECRFQVVASAGLRTTVADTASFTVPRKPRRVHLFSPTPQATFTAGEPVALRGGGFSPDFGTSAFSEGTWSSDKLGDLGSGYEIITHDLPTGRHTITLTVADGLGKIASASVEIEIEIRPDGKR